MRYKTVDAMMKGENFPIELRKQVKELTKQHSVTLELAKMRMRAGLTQEQMASKLDMTQGAISKLEASEDENVTLGEIRKYAAVCRHPLNLSFWRSGQIAILPSTAQAKTL